MGSVFFSQPSVPEPQLQIGWRWWFRVWMPVVLAIAVICAESSATFSAQNTSSFLRPILERILGPFGDAAHGLDAVEEGGKFDRAAQYRRRVASR